MKLSAPDRLRSLLLILSVLFLFQLSLASEWFHPDWQYRRPVTVPNPGSSDLTNFQVQITLDNSFDFSKAQTGGEDIRITADDGITLIPFWLESWDAVGEEATIWIKVPSIPVAGTTIYLYYGNLSPTIPPPDPIEMPPTGPFTRDVGNPIVLDGHPLGSSASLLAENMVYDDVTGHYWLVFAEYSSPNGIGLAWSDTPADATSWHYHGNVGAGNAPHIIKEGGLWYIFSSNLPNITYRTSATIDGTYSTPTVILSPSESWETYRVDEPFVFQRNDGKWVLAYMGDSGSTTEQVGYATADNITGPYTKFAGNPCIAFGPSGSFDAGTVADPWVYEYNGLYYIGYTVSSTKSSPWQTALATTSDWINFTKHGVIFPLAASGWDASNSFRGAVTRVGDTYVFSYTGDGYRMGIATQAIYKDPSEYINNPEEVFNFFDGFDGSSIDLAKWTFTSGSTSQTTVSGGQISLNATGTYIKINANYTFGMDYIGETRASHPSQGTQNQIAELGFADNSWNTVRIVDDFLLGTTYWQKQAKIAGGSDNFLNMAQTADPNWHVFQTYRQSPNIAGFRIDDHPTETVTTGTEGQSVPTGNLPLFLMSYGNGNHFVIDWTRVRKWAGSDPDPTVGNEQIQTSPITIIYTTTHISCFGESDGAIDISVTGGTGPYTYYWTPGGQTTQDISGIPAGSYSVSVTDSYNITGSSGVIVISQPDPIVPSATVTNPLICSEGTAMVMVTATGGSAPYSGTGSFQQTIGTTIYQITDDNSCTGEVSVTIDEPMPWYSDEWPFRREIGITNPGGNLLENFQIKINLDNSFDYENANENGDDIRLTSSDGTTLIPFWIERWTPAAGEATIWTKVPSIPTSGTSVFIYYGNPDPTIDLPVPVEVPPTGPFTRAVGNPVSPAGATGTSLLAENMVYDPVTEHYWLCMANYSQHTISLCYSDDPANAGSWTWGGNVITTFTQFSSGAPNLVHYNGMWYLFYADRPDIKVATATNVAGPYTINPTPALSPSGPSAWDSYRVDEPYVFYRESDNTWVMIYMGDAGSVTEQVGYATASNITGPYTAFAGNPCIAFGPSGSYDAGTVADPWVYKFGDVYYIGYTVSSSKSSPWQTACATTTDWQNFTKLGVIFPIALSGWDAVNSFRGAVIRIGDTYVLSYTGDSYKMGIATQPAYMTPETIINNPNAVFDFYDGFDGNSLDATKWTFNSGSISQANVSGGNLTLTHTSGDYPAIISQPTFGMDYVVETYARHPQQGTSNMVIETGFNQNFGDVVRLVDDFPSTLSNSTQTWNCQSKLASQGGDPNWFAMAQNADQAWHVFKVFRLSSGVAGFQIDDTPVETTSSGVPSSNLPIFMMSYTQSSPNEFIIGWTRVRKFTLEEPVVSIGTKLNNKRLWTGNSNNDWDNSGNWDEGTPENCMNVEIPSSAPNQPHITASPDSPAQCNNLTIDAGATLTIDPGKALTVNGTFTNNNGNNGLVVLSDASATGSLIEHNAINATVGRYLTHDQWHYISPPVDDPEAGVFIGMYLMNWDEPSGQWTYITNPGQILDTDMEGYAVWANDNSTVEFTGDLNTGPKAINTTYTADPGNNNKGFNFIGNPYPSSLDWNVDDGNGWTRTDGNINLSLYIWNGDAGNYGVYVKDASGGTNGVNNIIPPHQGFFVSCSAPTGSISVDDGARVHASLDILKSVNSDEPMFILRVSGNNFADETMFRIDQQASVQFDNNLDALKFRGNESSPQLYSISRDGRELSVNTFPETDDYSHIPIGFEAATDGIFTITVTQISGFDNKKIFLEDLVSGNFLKLDNKTVYSFNANMTDQSQRFILHFKMKEINEEENNDAIFVFSRDNHICVSVPDGSGTIKVYNIMGQVVAEAEAHDRTTTIPVYRAGTYLVSVINSSRNVVKKVLVK